MIDPTSIEGGRNSDKTGSSDYDDDDDDSDSDYEPSSSSSSSSYFDDEYDDDDYVSSDNDFDDNETEQALNEFYFDNGLHVTSIHNDNDDENEDTNHTSNNTDDQYDHQQQQEEERNDEGNENNDLNTNINNFINNSINRLKLLILLIKILFRTIKVIINILYTFIFSISIPYRQLHIISIALLCIHRLVEFVFNTLIPTIWNLILKYFIIIVGDNDSSNDGITNLNNERKHMFVHTNMTEMDILQNIIDYIDVQYLSILKTNHNEDNNEDIEILLSSGNTSAESLLLQLKKPILSIMIPTTILSIFLFLTTTIFLLIHMCFRVFLYFTTSRVPMDRNIHGNNAMAQGGDRRDDNNEFDSVSHVFTSSYSPFVIWGIVSILILETVMPWLCLSFGVYLSFSVGGWIWTLYIVIMYSVLAGLRYLRNRMFARFQDGLPAPNL